MHYFIWIAFAVLVSCDALDQTDKKRSPQQAQPAPVLGTSPSPIGTSSDSSSNSNSSTKPSQSNEPSPSGSIAGCDVKSFKTNLTGDVAKDINVPILGKVKVRGNGSLLIDLTSKVLKLNLGITNVTVDQPIAKGGVETELNKVKGERNMFLHDQSGMEKLKAKGEIWKKHGCDIGMVASYKFPYGEGTTVTVVFDPALPFAAFPAVASGESFAGAMGSGITFPGINGKVTEIVGKKPVEISVGDSATGKVVVSKIGAGFKFSYDFGAATNLVKMGLFNSATYTYSPDNVKQVEILSPVQQGQDTITILFK